MNIWWDVALPIGVVAVVLTMGIHASRKRDQQLRRVALQHGLTYALVPEPPMPSGGVVSASAVSGG
jgi:hypothetical protein